jgi:hypothetical protein
LSVPEARGVLAQLDAGELDQVLPAAARAVLRDAAEAAVGAAVELADEPAVAKVVAVQRDRRGVRTVTVACPYCRSRNGKPGRHTHGWGDDSPEPGSRVPHCVDGRRRGYRIELGEFGGAS